MILAWPWYADAFWIAAGVGYSGLQLVVVPRIARAAARRHGLPR